MGYLERLKKKQEKELQRRTQKLKKLLSARGIVDSIQQSYDGSGRLLWTLQFADGHIGRYSGAIADHVMPIVVYDVQSQHERRRGRNSSKKA